MNYLFEAVVTASSPVSKNRFLYFLGSHKNPYPLIHLILLDYIEYSRIAKLEERIISIYL